jgi:hypothetical protein
MSKYHYRPSFALIDAPILSARKRVRQSRPSRSHRANPTRGSTFMPNSNRFRIEARLYSGSGALVAGLAATSASPTGTIEVINQP